MRSCAVTQQGDVAKRGTPIAWITDSMVRHRAQPAPFGVFDFNPDRSINFTWDALCEVQPKHLPLINLVQNAPYLGIRVRTNVCRRRSAPWSSVEVKAQTVSFQTTNPRLRWAHSPLLEERLVVHVRAVSEVPNDIGGTSDEQKSMRTVINPRQRPGSCRYPSQSESYLSCDRPKHPTGSPTSKRRSIRCVERYFIGVELKPPMCPTESHYTEFVFKSRR
jgi:hypothetical protein